MIDKLKIILNKEVSLKTILLTFLGLFIVAILIIIFLYANEATVNKIKVISSLLIAVSVVIAALQFRLNRKQIERTNEWNTKQFGVTETYKSRRTIKEAINKLIKDLDVIERTKPFEVYEIHNAFGVFLSNGSFVFHGEQTDEDIRLLPKDDDDNGHISRFKNDTNGRDIKNLLLDILGDYEYISLGINNGTFHRETVLKLVAGPIRRNYKLFYKYIKHLQHHHKYGKAVFSEFRKLGIELMLEKRSEERKIKNARH